MMWPMGIVWCCAMAAGPASGGAEPNHQASEAVQPFTAQAEAALRNAAGEGGFKIKCTRHFAVAYDADGEGIGELLPRLESTYQSVNRFCRIHELPVSLPDKRLEVVFFDSYEQYAAYAGQVGFAQKGARGFYLDSTNRCAFFNTRRDPQFVALQRRVEEVQGNITALETAIRSATSDTPISVTFADGTSRQFGRAEARARIDETRTELTRIGHVLTNYCERINRMVIQHEAAHQILFNSGVHVRMAENPLWFVEGLACVFETPPTQSGAGLGVTNSMRLCDFRAAVGGGEPKGNLTEADYFRVVRAGTLADLKRLLADRTFFGQRGDDAGYAYSQAWALVHYLQRTKSRELATYIARVSRRRPGEKVSADRELADFEGAFGPADETFERAWVGWVLTLPFQPNEAGL